MELLNQSRDIVTQLHRLQNIKGRYSRTSDTHSQQFPPSSYIEHGLYQFAAGLRRVSTAHAASLFCSCIQRSCLMVLVHMHVRIIHVTAYTLPLTTPCNLHIRAWHPRRARAETTEENKEQRDQTQRDRIHTRKEARVRSNF